MALTISHLSGNRKPTTLFTVGGYLNENVEGAAVGGLMQK